MTFPEAERVIYKKNPLAGVICQFHFSPIAKIVEEAPTVFQERVHNPFAIYRVRDPFTEYAERIGTELATSPPNIREAMMKLIETEPNRRRMAITHEFTSEKDVWQISLLQTSLTVKCQKYQRWEDFKQHLSLALQALLDVYAPASFTRISLRYQDVVHRSYLGIEDVPWAELLQPYIAGELYSGVDESRIEKKLSEALIQLDTHNAKVSVHHGLANIENSTETGYIIDSEFYIEKQMEITDALLLLDKFNGDARRFFRWCITDRLHRAMEPRQVGKD